MKKLILSVLLLAGWGLSPSAAEMMTYQGRLKDGTMPANGNYSFSFALCSDGTGTGAGCSPDTAAQSFEAANGLFKSTFTIPAVDLSAGPWYLRVTVNSSVLVPLERLTFVPYSVFSSSAGYAYSASTLTALSGPAVFASTHVVVRGELTAGDWALAPSTYAVVEGAALLKDLNAGAQDVRVGVSGHAISATTENIDILAGGNFEAEIPTGKSGIMIGVRAGINNSGSSAQAVGVFVDGIGNTGTIADTYGILISTLYVGTQSNKPYAIYSEDPAARTYIAGNVGVSSVPAYALVVSSASGDVMWVSSYAVHGLKFVGDGSGLSGVTGATGTDPNALPLAGGTMTGQLTNTSSVTITGNGGAYGLAVSSNVSLSGVIYTANGNLGIGLSTASERLTLPYNGYLGWDANDTGDGVVVHKIGKSATGAAPLEFINNGNPGPAGKQFLFSAQGTEIFTLLDNGSVGISSTVPANKLAVSGGILAASSITAQGFMNAAYYQVNGSTVLAILPGSGSLGIGQNAGQKNTGAANSFVGYNAGANNTTGDGNSFFGYGAGNANTTGAQNTFLGNIAGYGNNTGINNSFVGNNSGKNNSTGSNNTVLGRYAAYYNALGSANAVLGEEAGYGSTGVSFSSSTIIGYQAGYSIAGGRNNILLGYKAGYSVTTGTGNIVIGDAEDTSALDANNELNIGGVLYGDLSARTVGISTRAPQAALDVVSTGTASNVYAQIWRAGDGVIKASVTATGVFYGDGSGLTGVTGATGTDPNALHTSGGTMTGQLTLLGSTLTVTGDAFSVGGSTLVVASGRVGIGTLAPSAELHVKNAYGRAFLESAAGNTAWLGLGHDSNAYWTITNNATGGDWLSFNNLGNASQLVLLQGGNLGVGANVPMARLHVRETSAAAQYALIVSTNSDAASYRLAVSTSGSLGVRVFPPAAALDVAAEGSGSFSYAQIWRDGSGVVVASMTSLGALNTAGISISSSGAIQTAGAGYGAVAGNARGRGAVDLQTWRGDPLQVASGNFSAIGGGMFNTASGPYAVVPGGSYSTASGAYSFAAGYGAVSSAQAAFTWQDSGGFFLDNNVADRTVFKNKGGFIVTGSTSTAMRANLDRGVFISGNGLVGISTGVPYAALDVVSTGTAANVYAQVWRDSSGVIVATVTSQGVFYGNGSGLAGISASGLTSAADIIINSAANTRIQNSGTDIATFLPGGTLQVNTANTGGAIKEALRLGNPGTGNTTGASLTFYNNGPTWEQAGIAGFYDNPTNSNTLAFYTGNGHTERMRVTGSGYVGIATDTPKDLFQVGGGTLTVLARGDVGIGTTAPGARLDVYSPNTVSFLEVHNASNLNRMAARIFQSSNHGLLDVFDINETVAIRLNADNASTSYLNAGNVGIGTTIPKARLDVQETDTANKNYSLRASTSDTSYHLVVTTGGWVGINEKAPHATLHIVGGTKDDGLVMQQSAAIKDSGYLGLLKSRGTPGAEQIVQQDDNLGLLAFSGYTGDPGNPYPMAAALRASVDGAPGALSMPARLEFMTTPAGTLTPITRMTINAKGDVGISTGTPGARLDVLAAGSTLLDYAQIWRDSAGVVKASVTATGILYADGSGLRNVTASGSVLKSGDTMTGALDMGGNFINGISTITIPGGSIAIVPPGTGGSNHGYGISIGSGSYNNYTSGVGVGFNATGNHDSGMGVGNNAASNFSSGVGAGNDAYNNFTYGVGVGYAAHNNYNWGVGVGANASGNYNYAVGIGAWSLNNGNYGAALGAYSYANSSGTALGSNSRANAQRSMAIGNGTVNDSTGTASFGGYGVYTSSDVFASRFHGDGSGLVNVSGTDATKVLKTGDTMGGTLVIYSDVLTKPDDLVTTGIIISTGGAMQTTGIGNGTVTGSARGTGAVDLQTSRIGTGQAAIGDFSVIGGGISNTANGYAAVVSGGQQNWAGTYSYATVGGGVGNSAIATYATVGGGSSNKASGYFSVVAGGQGNNVYQNNSAAAGGAFNVVSASNSFSGGGLYNTVAGTSSVVTGGENNAASDYLSFVGGGKNNAVVSSYSVVGGGGGNATYAIYSVIGGGFGNTANAGYNTIAGGSGNIVNNAFGAVGGGMVNTASEYGFVGGGYNNQANAVHSAVAGGWNNIAGGMDSFVGGGESNQTTSPHSLVAGGQGNFISGTDPYAVIGGGYGNSITGSGQYAVVGGGLKNFASMPYSAVLSGSTNTAGGQYAVVAGGWWNTAGALGTTIGGGLLNVANVSAYATIAGGSTNTASGYGSFIGGGEMNTVGQSYAAVGGGSYNYALGGYSVVPGGFNNTAKGTYSFAAGAKSSSTANGTFTWTDSQAVPLDNNVPDQVRFKAAGGFMVSGSTNAADPGLYVTGSGRVGVGAMNAFTGSRMSITEPVPNLTEQYVLKVGTGTSPEMLTVSTAGVVSMPMQSRARAIGGSGALAVPGAWAWIGGFSSSEDPQGEFDAINSWFKTKSGGVYLLSAHVSFQVVASSGTYRGLGFSVDGGGWTELRDQRAVITSTSLTSQEMTITRVVSLIPGQYLRLEAVQDSPGALNVNNAVFQVMKLH